MKKNKRQLVIKLIGKTKYGQEQIKKHGELWRVLEVQGTRILLLAKKKELEYKWINLENEHYDISEEY